jgi:hypothetical protein
MGLLDAPTYNPAKERRRRVKILVILAVAIALAFVIYLNRYWPEEHVVDKFFNALEKKDYKAAYSIWMHDPGWEQHPDKYTRYTYDEFYKDWGPGGEWGIIQTHKIDGSVSPKDGSGVVVVAQVNERSERARIWVEKSDKSLSFSPY